MTAPILALDIGGTKIAAGLVDVGGALTHHEQRPTPHGDAESVWAAWPRCWPTCAPRPAPT